MTHLLLQMEPMLWGACLWYWLWTLGAFLLGALLAWLLRDKPVPYDPTPIINERDRYHAAATKWETDYNSIKYQLEESQKAEADLRANLATCKADKHLLEQEVINARASAAAAFAAGTGAGAAGNAALSGLAGAGNDRSVEQDDILEETPDEDTDAAETTTTTTGTGHARIFPIADLDDGDDLDVRDDMDDAQSRYAGLFEPDNLQIIEGIGPKISQVLAESGYREWAALAAADVEDLRRLLQAAGTNYALSNPTSWPHQASLAAAGDWAELIRYQKFTAAGLETTGDFETESKFEKLANRELGFGGNDPTDLKIVEGIGPKIESLLKAAAIDTWADLAAADVPRLQTILDAASGRYKMAVPRSWPQQAALAAAGDWAALKALQAELSGGK